MNKRHVILRVYGDSLSMPRASKGIAYYQTYPELISDWYRSNSSDIKLSLYNRSRGGTTIDKLYRIYQHDSGYFGNIENDILIIQSGIVDCAPRPISKTMRRYVGKIPVQAIKTKVIKYLHEHRADLQRMRSQPCRFTDPMKFKVTYRSWLNQAINEFPRVYLVNIAPTIDSISEHSPGLRSSIEIYNEIIKEVVESFPSDRAILIDVFGSIRRDADQICKYIASDDGHHITFEGYQLYADLIIRFEATYFEQKGML